jgi:hypothetical protein
LAQEARCTGQSHKPPSSSPPKHLCALACACGRQRRDAPERDTAAAAASLAAACWVRLLACLCSDGIDALAQRRPRLARLVTALLPHLMRTVAAAPAAWWLRVSVSDARNLVSCTAHRKFSSQPGPTNAPPAACPAAALPCSAVEASPSAGRPAACRAPPGHQRPRTACGARTRGPCSRG